VPPVSGSIAAISANTIVVSMVKRPAMIQTAKIRIGDPSRAAISAGRIKIPEPIMVVMIRAVAVDSPMVRLKSWCCCGIIIFYL
jgi:hypothetical protein